MINNNISFDSDEFYISFMAERNELAKLFDTIVASIEPERAPQERSETALVIKGDDDEDHNRYLILYGDHREAYSALVPDLGKCLDYFRENIHLMGHSSDSLKEMV